MNMPLELTYFFILSEYAFILSLQSPPFAVHIPLFRILLAHYKYKQKNGFAHSCKC